MTEKNGSKSIISRDVTFHEEDMLKNSSELEVTNNQEPKPQKNVQLEVEEQPESLGIHEDQPETAPTQDLVDYSLARDRQRKEIRPPGRFGYADLKVYDLEVETEVLGKEPVSFEEAVDSPE